MKKKRIGLLILTSTFVSGCLSLSKPLHFVEEGQSKSGWASNGVVIFDENTTKPKEYESLGEAVGHFCHRNTANSGISKIMVENLLTKDAAKLGANGVIDVNCTVETKTDWAKNCWGTAKCTGQAIKYDVGAQKK